MKKQTAIVVHDSLGFQVSKGVANMGRWNGIGARHFSNEVAEEGGEDSIIWRLVPAQTALEILKLIDPGSKIAEPMLGRNPEHGLRVEKFCGLKRGK